MTRGKRRIDPWRAIALSYPCETCGAGPGERCTTSGGHVEAHMPHAYRTNLAAGRGWLAADEDGPPPSERWWSDDYEP